mmetsp:Transcript_143789/g.250995  ORF Transcript_143789/g.250995 Transcript_143789/m.250995 type:complete len:92 (-) Transcript_143789:40-315(-)
MIIYFLQYCHQWRDCYPAYDPKGRLPLVHCHPFLFFVGEASMEQGPCKEINPFKTYTLFGRSNTIGGCFALYFKLQVLALMNNVGPLLVIP